MPRNKKPNRERKATAPRAARQAPKPQQKPRAARPSGAPSDGMSRPSQCRLGTACSAYCLSICDPRSFASKIPIGPMRPSNIITTRARGTLNTGTVGYAGIIVNPWGTLFSDVSSIWTTDPANTFDSAVDTLGQVAALKYVAAAMPSPYVSTDFTDAVAATAPLTGRARLVSLGIYLEYAGAELYKAGQFVSGFQPDGVTLVSTVANTVFQQNWVSQRPVAEAPARGIRVVYLPTDMDNTDYISKEELAAGSYAARNIFASLVGGPLAGSGSSGAVRWELVANWEVAFPANMQLNGLFEPISNQSVGTPDPMGAQDVIAAAARHAQTAATAAGITPASIAETIGAFVADRAPVAMASVAAALAGGAAVGAGTHAARIARGHGMRLPIAWRGRDEL